MSDEAQQPSPTGPLSWRDVYTAVGDSEARLTKVIKDAVEPLVKSDSDHEARIRSLESGSGGQVQANATAIADMRLQVAALQLRDTKQDGATALAGIAARVAIIAFAAMGAAVAAADLIARLSESSPV